MSLEEQVRKAVARGWCDPRNSHKEMDVDLADAIAAEVIESFRPAPDLRGNHLTPIGAPPMPRDLYEIARECAEDVVSTAQCAGYEISGKRGVFFRSDLGNLADTITDWLQAHMELEPEPGLPSVDDVRGILSDT